ncbi:phosphoglycerate mutase family protein [Spongiibacter taiwanensis]|uniref:histidine phosphatase family protein n=1 Tax=Spongiibacter taiwanensis TaxID=1748242 RepID=UPI0020353FDC|nr:histidine phosphatase family protein [Spongiibacter taiwanensis]USA42518.1 phosphoglycerate mutase family protein [Spongiibacter taiwanensis]
MVRTVIALLRHGDYHQQADTPSALQPWPLTETGRAQARAAAPQLMDFCAEHQLTLAHQIDCSSLLRAWQTAQILADELTRLTGTAVTTASFDALWERNVGSAANLTTTQIQQAVASDPRCPPLPDNWKSDSHFRLPLPGAESLMDAGHRVASHIEGAMTNTGSDPQLKVFVGHGAAIRHAASVMGALAESDIPTLSMYHAQPVFLERIDDHWHHIGGNWKIRHREAHAD